MFVSQSLCTLLHDLQQLWNEINAFQRCKNYWNRSRIDAIMKLWKHENLKKVKNLRTWQSSWAKNYFANVSINHKFEFSKKKIFTAIKTTVKIIFNLERCSCYFHASQHMIKIEINQIMKLDKRFSTLQKWVKSKTWCKKYCTLKFFAHQIQRNEMFFVFVALMFDKFEDEIWNDWFSRRSHSK